MSYAGSSVRKSARAVVRAPTGKVVAASEDYLLQNRVICLTSPLSGILRAPLRAHLPEKWCPLLGITCYKIVVFVSGRVLCLEFCARRCARAFRKGGGRFRGLPVTKLGYVSYVLSSVRNSARAVMRAPSVKVVAASEDYLLITKLSCLSYVLSSVRNSVRAAARAPSRKLVAASEEYLLENRRICLMLGPLAGILRAPLCALAFFQETISHYVLSVFYRDL